MLQSSFFGGPKGKNLIISKIYESAADLIANELGSVISPVGYGDYVLISYGPAGDHKYIENQEKDKVLFRSDIVNYNGKIYKKEIGVISAEAKAIPYNILYDINANIGADVEQIHFKLVVDLIVSAAPSQLAYTLGEPGERTMLRPIDGSSYELIWCPPSYEIVNSGTVDKLVIKNNGEEVGRIPFQWLNMPGNNFIEKIAVLKYSFQNEDIVSFEDSLLGWLKENEDELKLDNGTWYTLQCDCADIQHENLTTKAVVFIYKNGETIQWAAIRPPDQFAYTEIQLPEYLAEEGIKTKNGITKINNDNGRIYNQNILLPGQTITITEEDAGRVWHNADIMNEEQTQRYIASPVEKRLWEEVQYLRQQHSSTGRELFNYTYNDNNRNNRLYLKGTSSSYDIFKDGDTLINSTYMVPLEDGKNTYDFNLIDISENYNENHPRPTSGMSKYVIEYELKPSAGNIMLEFININQTAASKKRKEKISISPFLPKQYGKIELRVWHNTENSDILYPNSFTKDYSTTLYYHETMNEDRYSTLAQPTLPLNQFFISIRTNTTLQNKKATSVYYSNFGDYFNSFKVTKYTSDNSWALL